jgi:hypothetical protein
MKFVDKKTKDALKAAQNKTAPEKKAPSVDPEMGCAVLVIVLLSLPLYALLAAIFAAPIAGGDAKALSGWFWGIFIVILIIAIPIQCSNILDDLRKPSRRRNYGSASGGGASNHGYNSSSGNIEDYRSVAESRRHRAQGSGNWTSRDDWNCGPADNDGMAGWDSYEENDF